MLFRVMDIETVPDMTVFTPGEPKWVQKVNVELRPAGNSLNGKDPPLVEVPVVSWVKEDPFPPPQAHRVVAISWCDIAMSAPSGNDSRTYQFACMHTSAAWRTPEDERRLIADFRRAQLAEPATIITWNGRTFDLPVLAMRALLHGIPWNWYYDGRGLRYRYSDEGHCDLMDFLSDYGATRQMKLGDACKVVGLPGKTDMDGSKVADLVLAPDSPKAIMANMTKVAKYCLQDTIQTSLLFIRSRFHLGLLTLGGYRESINSFKSNVSEIISIDWDKLDIKPGEED